MKPNTNVILNEKYAKLHYTYIHYKYTHDSLNLND